MRGACGAQAEERWENKYEQNDGLVWRMTADLEIFTGIAQTTLEESDDEEEE